MVIEYYPNKGDVIEITFGPSLGHEQKGKRPALVLSDKEYSERSKLIVCIPLTTKTKGYMFEVEANFQNIKGSILVDQIRVFDISIRKIKKIGEISKNIIEEVNEALKIFLSL